MADINCTVGRGYTFVEDANGLVQLTKDRLNLLGYPSVSLPVDEDYIPKVVITVGDESGDTRSISVQVQSVNSNNAAHSYLLHAWLSDSAPGAETSGSPTADWTTGTKLETTTANKRWQVVTNTSGAAVLSVTQAGAVGPFYLCIELDGRIWTSSAFSFTA